MHPELAVIKGQSTSSSDPLEDNHGLSPFCEGGCASTMFNGVKSITETRIGL